MIAFIPRSRVSRRVTVICFIGTIVMEDGRADIAERIRNIIVEQLAVEKSKVVDDASIVDDLGADSLEMVQIVMLIEDEFGIAIPDQPAEELLTVRDAIDFVVASQP
jgi:acyl carrier protein